MSRLIFTASLAVLFVSFVHGLEELQHRHHPTHHHGHHPDQCEPYCEPGVIGYYPDIINCTKFWHCDNGVPVRHICPHGLYFNPSNSVCDFPIQSGCTANANNACHPKTTTPEPETTTPEPETTTYAPETTTPEPETTTREPTTPKHHPTQCEPYCRPGDRYYTPDTINCTKFWHCDNGVPVRHFCPQGLYFNPDRRFCTYPIQAGCTANANNPCHPRTTTPEPETTTYAPETTTPEPETTTYAPETTTPEPETTTYAPETTTPEPETTTREPTTPKHHPTQCEPYCTPDISYYTPDTINCTKFWRCHDGEASVQACPQGFYFNPKTWACNYPIQAGCTANPNNPCHPRTTTPEPETTTYKPETTTVEPQTTTYKPETTTYKPETTTYKPETTTVKPQTTTYKPETTTVAPETTTKKPETTTVAPKTTTVVPETTTVAPETTTVAPKTTTVVPETTTVAPETTTVAPETTTVAPKTTTVVPETTTVAPETTTSKPETTTYKPETTTPKHGPTATLAPCKPDGCVPGVINYFPDVRDCTKFWQCDHGEPVHKMCPKGLYFNPTYWICDFPEHAGCTAKPNNPCHPKSTTYLPISTAEPTTGTFKPETTTSKPETTTYEPETTTSKPETTTYEPYSTRNPISTTTNPHPHGCKPDCPAGLIVYYPDLRSCSKYWGCFNGIAVPQYCKPGLYFNPNIWVCERPEFSQCTADPNVHCHNVTTHVPVSTTRAPILTTTATPETTTATPKCVPPCPFFEAMYPNPRNCNQFFKCAHDFPYLMDCPAGLEFSIFTNRCEYPKDAMCIDGPDIPCKARIMLH